MTPGRYSASSEEAGGEGPVNGYIKAAFDGDPATFWHTQWDGAEPAHPHSVTMDLGEATELCAFNHLPRADGNGRITDYEIHVSDDGTTWGDPVASGTFGTDAAWQGAALAGVTARYVRLTTKASITAEGAPGAVWATAAEFALTRAEAPLEVPEEPTPSEDPTSEPDPSEDPTEGPTTEPTPTAPPAPTSEPTPTSGPSNPSKPRPGLPSTGQ